MQDTFAFDEGINREADTSGSGDTRPNRGHSVVGASRALAAPALVLLRPQGAPA